MLVSMIFSDRCTSLHWFFRDFQWFCVIVAQAFIDFRKTFTNFAVIVNSFEWSSITFIDSSLFIHRFSYIFLVIFMYFVLDFHWVSMILFTNSRYFLSDVQWLSNDLYWLSTASQYFFNEFSMFLQWFSSSFERCSMIAWWVSMSFHLVLLIVAWF